jgi:hypothetical protein
LQRSTLKNKEIFLTIDITNEEETFATININNEEETIATINITNEEETFATMLPALASIICRPNDEVVTILQG